jgi:hypothetical protein
MANNQWRFSWRYLTHNAWLVIILLQLLLATNGDTRSFIGVAAQTTPGEWSWVSGSPTGGVTRDVHNEQSNNGGGTSRLGDRYGAALVIVEPDIDLQATLAAAQPISVVSCSFNLSCVCLSSRLLLSCKHTRMRTCTHTYICTSTS